MTSPCVCDILLPRFSLSYLVDDASFFTSTASSLRNMDTSASGVDGFAARIRVVRSLEFMIDNSGVGGSSGCVTVSVSGILLMSSVRLPRCSFTLDDGFSDLNIALSAVSTRCPPFFPDAILYLLNLLLIGVSAVVSLDAPSIFW